MTPDIPAIDESLYAAGEAVERIESIVEALYSDLTGSDAPATRCKVVQGGALTIGAHGLCQRLQIVANRLPEVCALIVVPKVAQIGSGNTGGGQSISLERSAMRWVGDHK